jgi:xylulokinase
MVFAGIDIGTTRAKISVFDNGTLLASFSEDYSVKRSALSETVDPEGIFAVVQRLIIKVSSLYPTLAAVGVTSFGECFVLLGRDNRVLYDAMLYSDPRGLIEAEEIRGVFGDEWLSTNVGNAANAMFSLPKLLYIKKHNPEVYAEAVFLDLMEDYIVYRLSGVRQIDYTLACRTMAFDIRTLSWNEEILRAFGIDPSLFPTPVEAGSIAGPIKKELSERLGVSSSLLVITGAHDQIAASLGVGCLQEGDVSDGMGTCECLAPLYSSLDQKSELAKRGFGIIPYLRKGLFTSYGMINTAGALFKWFLDTFFHDEMGKDATIYRFLEERLPSMPTNVLISPNFAGSGTPHVNPLASGAICNLSLYTSREEIYQAIIESLSYELRFNMEFLKNHGIKPKKLLASGGGSKNEVWIQRKADILGIPVVVFETPDCGTVGSGIIIGKALGLFASFEDGVEKMTHVKKEYQPNFSNQDAYEERYRHYIRLYHVLEQLNGRE